MQRSLSSPLAHNYHDPGLAFSNFADASCESPGSSGVLGREPRPGSGVAGFNGRDVYVASPSPAVSVPKAPLSAPSKPSGFAYKLKQYSTDTMIIGGSLTAFCLLLFPEPVFSTLCGATLGLVCAIAGAVLKHHFFRKAHKAGALVETVGRLKQNVNQLDSEIGKLEQARCDLDLSASSLATTQEELQSEVGRLETQVTALNREVAEAFDQLNVDRATFEQEKNAMLRQLADEIFEADERGDRAQTKLDRINEREDRLSELKAELETRRKDLLHDEAKLAALQDRLIARFTHR